MDSGRKLQCKKEISFSIEYFHISAVCSKSQWPQNSQWPIPSSATKCSIVSPSKAERLIHPTANSFSLQPQTISSTIDKPTDKTKSKNIYPIWFFPLCARPIYCAPCTLYITESLAVRIVCSWYREDLRSFENDPSARTSRFSCNRCARFLE